MKSLLSRLSLLVGALALALGAFGQAPAKVDSILPPADRLDRRPPAMPANPKLPTIWVIGDSTVRNGSDDGQGKGAEGMWGWGHMLPAYFDPAKVNVVNRAVGGLSSRTYLTGGFWAKVLPLLKAGDVVIMQFGHNDDWALNNEIPGQPLRARGTIKGIGEETKEIDNVMTKKHEVVHTYGWYLRKFVDDARTQGATAVICSPIPRKNWDDAGRVRRSPTTYSGWAQAVAAQERVGFVNLNELIAGVYDRLGHDAVMKLFPGEEHTHTNQAGAVLNARCVVAGLRLLANDPVAADFSAAGLAVDPAQPDRDAAAGP